MVIRRGTVFTVNHSGVTVAAAFRCTEGGIISVRQV